MNILVLISSLMLSLPLLANDSKILLESPSTLAAIQSLKTFADDFESDTGNTIDKEIIGVSSTLETGDAETTVYSASTATDSVKNTYHCHFHYTSMNLVEEAHCHREEENTSFTYIQVARKYILNEFEEASIHALELFAEKNKVNQIFKTKIWQNSNNIELIFNWLDGEQLKNTYIMCHYHGSHMDCHKQSRPGQNEPIEEVEL